MDTTPNTTPAAPAAAEAPEQTQISRELQTMHAWIDADVKAGRFSAGQGAKMKAEAAGEDEQQPAAATAPDEESQWLTSQGFPPAQESALRLREHFATGDQQMTPELRAAEKTVTAWLIDSKLPAPI